MSLCLGRSQLLPFLYLYFQSLIIFPSVGEELAKEKVPISLSYSTVEIVNEITYYFNLFYLFSLKVQIFRTNTSSFSEGKIPKIYHLIWNAFQIPTSLYILCLPLSIVSLSLEIFTAFNFLMVMYLCVIISQTLVYWKINCHNISTFVFNKLSNGFILGSPEFLLLHLLL